VWLERSSIISQFVGYVETNFAIVRCFLLFYSFIFFDLLKPFAQIVDGKGLSTETALMPITRLESRSIAIDSCDSDYSLLIFNFSIYYLFIYLLID